MLFNHSLSIQSCRVGIVLSAFFIACWCAMQPMLDPTVFFYVRLVMGIVSSLFVIYQGLRWKEQGWSDDLLLFSLLLIGWGFFFHLGVSQFTLYVYLGFGAALLLSIGLALVSLLKAQTEESPTVVWADPMMGKQGNPALEGYLWSQDYESLLDWLDDNRIAVVSVSDGKAVDQIFYLRKLRNGDQEEYRAWNRHECLTVWSSEQHDGRIFSDRCAELQLRFLQ